MQNNKVIKKLQLNRETIVILSDDLERVRGGVGPVVSAVTLASAAAISIVQTAQGGRDPGGPPRGGQGAPPQRPQAPRGR